MTTTWTLTFERSKQAAGKPLRKTVTVAADSMIEAIVAGRVRLYHEGSGLDWKPIEAKCV